MASSALTLSQIHNKNQNFVQHQQKQEIQLGNLIGSGKTSNVYECYIGQQLYAVKVYKKEHMKFFNSENNSLSQISHPNIIGYGSGDANKGYILLQNCPNGELFDFVQYANGKFPAQLARFYSLQLTHALGYLHSNQMAHLDIKLENCLLDENYNLKIADFGFASDCQLVQKEKRFIGTHRYMSPEIEKQVPYNAKKADIFALGCVIFILELGFQPIYQKAHEKDKYYQYFAYGKQDILWNWIEKSYGNKLNPDFKDLINKMLQINPKNRIDIEQVLGHPYFKGLVFDQASRQQYMDKIKQQMKNNQQMEQE